MKRSDRIKLNFTRNWNFPGKERLAHWFRPSASLKQDLKDGIVWLNHENIAIYTTANNYIEWTILCTGTYEDEINKLIRISLQPGDTALDIGGNIGLQSIRMAQCVGDTGKVLAFEPLQYLQKKFSRNAALNRMSNITLFPVALSDKEGEMDFDIDEEAWNQGTFNLNHAGGPKRQKVSVKIADNIPDINSLTRLSLIKIDVEGFEFHAMRGLAGTIGKHKPRIIFEYDSDYWVKAGENISDCLHFLSGFGYQAYQVTSVGCELIASAENITGGNIFCISV